MSEEALKPDWERIEVDYRAGMKTLRVIASENGICAATIVKRAKGGAWDRDLSAKIAAKAQDKVNKAAVNTEVNKKTEKAIVEANAALQADIIVSHRKDVPLKRELVNKLFTELEAVTDGKDIIKQLASALRKEDKIALATAADRIITLPKRIKGVSDLMSAYKTVIGLEREVFGIKSDSGPNEELGEIVRRIVRE